MAADEFDEKRLRALRERGLIRGAPEYDEIVAQLARLRFLQGAPLKDCLDDPRLRAIADRGPIFGAEEYDQFQPGLAFLRLFREAQSKGLVSDPHAAKKPKPQAKPSATMREP